MLLYRLINMIFVFIIRLESIKRILGLFLAKYLEKWVFESVIDRDSFLGIFPQHLLDQIFTVFRNHFKRTMVVIRVRIFYHLEGLPFIRF